jgi:hypothetical protein
VLASGPLLRGEEKTSGGTGFLRTDIIWSKQTLPERGQGFTSSTKRRAPYGVRHEGGDRPLLDVAHAGEPGVAGRERLCFEQRVELRIVVDARLHPKLMHLSRSTG